MRMNEQTESLMRQLIERADAAAANPAAVLFGTFEGRSRSGAVTVWVDANGRLERVELTPDSIDAGDEAMVTRELMEAYAAAAANAEKLVLEASSGWQHQSPPDQPAPAAPERRRADRDDDDDYGEFSVLHRY